MARYRAQRARALELGDRNLVAEIDAAAARLGVSLAEPETTVDRRALEAPVPPRPRGHPRGR